jgi:triacylglycerol lipase
MEIIMKKISILYYLFIILLISSEGRSLSGKTGPDYCAVQYPVILVHGIGFRDKTVLGKYWGSTSAVLIEHGAKVFSGGQDAYGAIAVNAGLLKNQILAILVKTGAKKVNIIAHSRGGIESRYMISKLDMQDIVASLTTISTPHHGSIMADIIMKQINDESVFTSVIDFFAKIMGDNNPESFNAGKELTRAAMKDFNLKVPDAKSVYYQSYAGEIDASVAHPVWKLMFNTISKYEGANDGLVSIDSAKWGEFKGTMSCSGKARVSHADEVGMHFLSGMFCFNYEDFYLTLVHELKLKGF